jgi:haloacid dehalogenase-like hydrolase
MLYRATLGAADLHADVPELVHRLLRAADGGDFVDAYLFACGIGQVVEDRLAGTDSVPRRLVKHLGTGRPGGVLRRVLDLADGVADRLPARRALRAWNGRVALVTEALAAGVMSGDRKVGCVELMRGGPPGVCGGLLSGRLLRQPTCFRSFDQRPEDVRVLASRFAGQYPDRSVPVLVLGVRTSGSYLAPLLGAALRSLGYSDVLVRSTRPGARLLAGEGRTLRALRRAGGLVVVIDDPPASGGSLDSVAASVERSGFPRGSVVVACATFPSGVGVCSGRRPCVVLSAFEWEIRRKLGRDAVLRLASVLLPGRVVEISAEPVGVPSRSRHLSVEFSARFADGGSLRLVASGAGLGYLGRHAVEVSGLLAGQVPHVYGIVDGVLLRECLPGEGRVDGGGDVPPEAVAQYVVARRAMELPSDRSVLLSGREPVWEIAARLLARGLGRLGDVLRPVMLDRLSRMILATDRPCLVDGDMRPGLWFEDGAGEWVKTDYDEACFSRLDLASYDAVYDLAGAAFARPELEDRLIARFEQLTGSRIRESQWCVYKLVHAWNARRLGGVDPRRSQARAVQRYLSSLYLEGLDSQAEGPWCALDVDGVLENDAFGFSITSPAGMMALRALRAHGYRVLLATGRSLTDVKDRCEAYRLAGGVAEYGAVVYDARADRSRGLVAEADGELADRLRALPEVSVDSDYQWCVRAFRSAGGERIGLRLGAGGVGEAGDGGVGVLDRYSVVRGIAQTDFLPRGVDKARGVRELIRWMGGMGSGEGELALAVGDSAADVGMLTAARLGLAPGNADRGAMRAAGVPVLRGSYQAGLASAVGRLIGHRPGGCAACRPPVVGVEDRALLSVLAIPEAGRAGAPARLLRLAQEALR